MLTSDEIRALLDFQPTGGGEFLLALIRAGAMTRALVDEALRRHDLTSLDQELLEHLSREPGASTSCLARGLHVKRQTADKALSRLHDAGLVEGHPSRSDRRATQWHLTPAGTERLAASRQRLARLQATLLDDLPEADCVHLGELLQHVSSAVRFEQRRRLWAIIRSRW